MAAPRDPLRRLVDRLARRTRVPVEFEPMPPDPRLPEQRLLDAAARYGRIVSGDGSGHRWTDAASAGVRTVPPTDPSDADSPVWVRRLGDRAGVVSVPTDAKPVPMDAGSDRPVVGTSRSGRS